MIPFRYIDSGRDIHRIRLAPCKRRAPVEPNEQQERILQMSQPRDVASVELSDARF